MGEEITEPREILKRTRIEVMPYLREIAEHSRAIIPRMQISKRWMDYYEAVSKVRPLTASERRKLEEHRKAYDVLASRLEVYRAAGRYARTKKSEDLVALRQAQSRYYEAKATTLPPEKAREVREKMVPLKEAYDELAATESEIGEKCKRYKAVKYKSTFETALMEPLRREAELKRVGARIRDLYVRKHEITQNLKAFEMSDLLRSYGEVKGVGG